MSVKRLASSGWRCLRAGLASVAMFQFVIGASLASAAPPQNSRNNETTSPIKHVIVIIG
jgi:phospholipase C